MSDVSVLGSSALIRRKIRHPPLNFSGIGCQTCRSRTHHFGISASAEGLTELRCMVTVAKVGLDSGRSREELQEGSVITTRSLSRLGQCQTVSSSLSPCIKFRTDWPKWALLITKNIYISIYVTLQTSLKSLKKITCTSYRAQMFSACPLDRDKTLPYCNLWSTEKSVTLYFSKYAKSINVSVSMNLHSKATELDRNILYMLHVICSKLCWDLSKDESLMTWNVFL